jgi:hypothetical protein
VPDKQETNRASARLASAEIYMVMSFLWDEVAALEDEVS